VNNNLGRDKLPWSQDRWDRIDQSVHDEMQRILIDRRFVPVVPMADALTVPADTITTSDGLLEINEASITEVIEIWVEFALTKQQVEGEMDLSSAVTLATRAANLLAQGEDLLVNQGNGVIKNNELFVDGQIHTRAGPGPAGLANRRALPDPDKQVIAVPFSDKSRRKYGENTFGAVSRAYALLQKQGHYGPYALELPTEPNADTRAPLENTLIMPADRIIPLVDGRLYGTGTLPEKPDLLGVMVSLGGNSIDMVVGRDATTAFVQEDNEGLYRFRVFERFALRDKDPTSRILLEFERSDVDGVVARSTRATPRSRKA
jgi:uncharacterized linocin/CFP29 family protein